MSTVKLTTLPCIVCSRSQQHDVSVFSTPGSYSSRLFDPMDGRELNIVVCDDCLKVAARREQVAQDQLKRLVMADGPRGREWVGMERINRGAHIFDPTVDYHDPDDVLTWNCDLHSMADRGQIELFSAAAAHTIPWVCSQNDCTRTNLNNSRS